MRNRGTLLQSSSDLFLDHYAWIVALIPMPDYYLEIKGELHSKTIFKGVKDWDKTKISPLFIFNFGVLIKRYKPPKQKCCTPCS
jgi:hypothetical protein